MKHTLEELLATVYRYYPRGLSVDDPRYKESEEWRRIVAERCRAGANCESWRQLLRRLGEQFPEYSVQNRAIHLPVGGADASYSAYVHMPVTTPGEHSRSLGFLVTRSRAPLNGWTSCCPIRGGSADGSFRIGIRWRTSATGFT